MKKYFLIVGDPVGSENGTLTVKTLAEAQTWREAVTKANKLWTQWEANVNKLKDKYNLIAIEEYAMNEINEIEEKEYIRSHCQFTNGEWD